MPTPAETVDRYIAMWNETDPASRRDIIRGLWSEDCDHLDPTTRAVGRDGIDGLVAAVQERFPGHQFRRTSEVDSHSGHIRFSWSLTADRGGPALSGTDFGALTEDGRLRRITAFFDGGATARPLG